MLTAGMQLPADIGAGAALASVAAVPARAQVQPASEIDRQFVCPEALPDDASRMAALRAFGDAYTSEHPGLTVADMLGYRRVLLEKHGCSQTLANLAGAEAALRAGDVDLQAWLPIEQNPVAQVYGSSDHLKVILDPRFPNERAVETYTKLAFTAPRTTNQTHVEFDQVISHAIYYCRSHRYALVQNDYFLGGQETLKDPSPHQTVSGVAVFDLAATPRGSYNATAERWACSNAAGAVG